jgi:hypothetical protein
MNGSIEADLQKQRLQSFSTEVVSSTGRPISASLQKRPNCFSAIIDANGMDRILRKGLKQSEIQRKQESGDRREQIAEPPSRMASGIIA